MKKTIMAEMERAEKAFIPKGPGERKFNEQKAGERAMHHEKLNVARETSLDTCCH